MVVLITVVYTMQLANCDEEMKCDYLSPKENCTYLINYAEFLSGQDDGQKDFCSGYFIKRALDLCERFSLNWEACTVSMRKECHPVSGIYTSTSHGTHPPSLLTPRPATTEDNDYPLFHNSSRCTFSLLFKL